MSRKSTKVEDEMVHVKPSERTSRLNVPATALFDTKVPIELLQQTDRQLVINRQNSRNRRNKTLVRADK